MTSGAAKALPTGLAAPGHNYVGECQIWKDYIHHASYSAKNWDKTWLFMKTDYKDLIREEYPEVDNRKLIPIPKHLQIAQGPSLEDCVQVYPSVKPVPMTTTGQIGWRSGDKELNLEKYGRYSRPRGGLVKQLKWPNEAVG